MTETLVVMAYIIGLLVGYILGKKDTHNNVLTEEKTPKVGTNKDKKEVYDSAGKDSFYCCLCNTRDESKCICPYK